MSGGGYGQSPMQGSFGNRQAYGGQGMSYQPRGGGFQYQPQMSGEFQGGQPEYRLGAGAPRYGPTNDPNRIDLMGFGPQAQAPQPAQKSWGGQGFTGMEFMGGRQQQPPMQTPGFDVMQRQAPVQPFQPPQPQGQSFEQFAQTLGNSGMTSGQMQDLYAKQSQGNYNFGANTGVGTQRPAGFTPPDTWGPQTYGFDPRSMAGKNVTKDLGWYYGMDAVGRPINDQGDAYSQFRSPADGYQRTNPWQKG